MARHSKRASTRTQNATPGNSPIAFTTDLPLDHAGAIDAVTARLREEGFGVITRIDAHETFQEKLGRSFRPYTILGACNPELAHQLLSGNPEAGLMLPCNVVVEESEPGSSTVRIADPRTMLGLGGLDEDRQLVALAGDARAALSRVAKALASQDNPGT